MAREIDLDRNPDRDETDFETEIDPVVRIEQLEKDRDRLLAIKLELESQLSHLEARIREQDREIAALSCSDDIIVEGLSLPQRTKLEAFIKTEIYPDYSDQKKYLNF